MSCTPLVSFEVNATSHLSNEDLPNHLVRGTLVDRSELVAVLAPCACIDKRHTGHQKGAARLTWCVELDQGVGTLSKSFVELDIVQLNHIRGKYVGAQKRRRQAEETDRYRHAMRR